jgi:hypothetical protein
MRIGRRLAEQTEERGSFGLVGNQREELLELVADQQQRCPL